jgi:very-short-patch-repair endonuclease
MTNCFQNITRKARTKRLRRTMTPVERNLWHHLHAHRFKVFPCAVMPCLALQRRRSDPRRRLIIEADGSGHCSPRRRDRNPWLATQGFRVL